MPANLIHYRHSLSLTIDVRNSPSEQMFWANGAVEQLGAAKWKVDFPAHFTALSPM